MAFLDRLEDISVNFQIGIIKELQKQSLLTEEQAQKTIQLIALKCVPTNISTEDEQMASHIENKPRR